MSTTDYSHFDPREYLRQYYTLPEVSDDEAAIFRFIAEKFAGVPVVDCGLEFGCGPTIHHAFGLANAAREWHLAEYLPGNRDEVQKWLTAAADAHDWDPQLRGILEIEGRPAELESRKALLRERVSELLPCNLFRDPPIDEPRGYDLVTSFFTAECLGGTMAEWETYMARILKLVNPGGTALFAALRNASRYSVLGRWFATTPVNEADFARVFAFNGFDESTIDSRGVPITAWAEEGFDSIVLAYVKKPGVAR